MTWILFSILAALSWAIVHILDKIILTKLIKNPVISLLFLGIIGLIISFFVYLFYGFSELSYFNILLSFIASICYVLMIYFYFKATQLEEISRVVSFFRITPLFVLIFSIFLFNEIFSFSKYLGIILLIAGSILISLKRSVKLTFGKSFWFIIIAAIVFAINTIITKYLLNFA
ncbi:MAG: EamA family transporter, partial [Nitrospirota bacterium]|nr:EamA family transporter [Nitrospirota bacterium]